ncbi:MAG: hypothetical protein CVU73_06560 [Deltaproteobacteria bacterium HGW-Deltaproteobacteria-8]|jgi:hypothetical protein|nr:MAG: hypothetical protein CVU73_06560 [Deltaproteobacteria bacterium HGW-Deltaproteobacteria-8]
MALTKDPQVKTGVQHQQETGTGILTHALATGATCSAAYCLAYLFPLFALDFRHGFLWPMVSLGLAAWLQYRFPAHRAIIVFCLIMSTCALALFGLWRSGLSDGHVLGGVLPFLDGGSYFHDTLNYLAKGHFSFQSSRRPIFTAYLTSLYVLLGQDYRLTLLVMVLVAGLSIFFAARSVGKTCGGWAELGMAFVLLLFYRAFVGTALTENIGLALGAVAFACIWDANATAARRLHYWGLFFLALGLNARAGAFFILPALALWAGARYRDNAKYSIRTFAMCILAISAAFAINYLLLVRVGTPAAGFSNFALVLYGLLTGGDWTTFFTHNPQLLTIPESEAIKIAYATSLKLITDDPGRLVRGMLRAWREMYVGGYFGSYTFVWVHSVDLTPNILRFMSIAAISGLLNFGLVSCLSLLSLPKHRARTTASALVLASFAGIFLSVPFAPPWDAVLLRAYAATIPFQVMVPVFGLSLLSGQMQNAAHGTGSPGGEGRAWLLGLGITLLCLAPALYIARGNPTDTLRTAAAYETGNSIGLNLQHAVSVTVGQDSQFFDPTTVSLDAYRGTQRLAGESFQKTLGPKLAEDLAACTAGSKLWMTIDQGLDRNLYLVSGQGFVQPQGLFGLALLDERVSSHPWRVLHLRRNQIFQQTTE